VAIIFDGGSDGLYVDAATSNGAVSRLFHFRARFPAAALGTQRNIVFSAFSVGADLDSFGIFGAGSAGVRRGLRVYSKLDHEFRFFHFEFGGTAIYDGVWRNYCVFAANTPGGAHSAYVDGVSQSLEDNGNTAEPYDPANLDQVVHGRNPRTLETGYVDLEFLSFWSNIATPSAELMRALSLGAHPHLFDLPRADYAVEFPGEVRLPSGGAVATNINSGYEAGGGYSYWPASGLFYPPISSSLPATLAGIVEGLSGSATALVGYASDLTGAAPIFTASAQTIADAPATLTATVEGLSGSATATIAGAVTATLTGTAPTFTASAQSIVDAPANLTATVEGLSGSATATIAGAVTATLTGTAPTFTASAQSIVDAPANLTATVEGLSGSATATIAGAVMASLTGTAPTFTASAQSIVDAPANLTATVEGLSGSATATIAGAVMASLTGTAPTFTASAQALVDAPATLAGIVPSFTPSAVAAINAPATLVATMQGLAGTGVMIIPELVTTLTAIDPRRAALGQLDFIDRPTVSGLALVDNPTVS
jgi:hypothetical protein